MMAIGDVNRFGPHEPGDFADEFLIGYRPQSADRAKMIGGLQRQCATNGLIEPSLNLVGCVGVHAEYGAEIHTGRAHELEPIFLRPCERLLVRKNLARTERLQSHAREESAANTRAAIELVLLVIDVKTPSRVLLNDARLDPIPKQSGAARVAIAVRIVARLIAAEIDMNDVVRAAPFEFLLKLRPDHIVRRGYQVTE